MAKKERYRDNNLESVQSVEELRKIVILLVAQLDVDVYVYREHSLAPKEFDFVAREHYDDGDCC